MAPDAVDLPVSREELTATVAALADDVAERERRLRPELPTEDATGIGDCFEAVRRDWESGSRSMRTFPVVNVFARLDVPISAAVRRLLVALDVKVVTLDDVIDTRDLGHEAKTCASVRAAFSTLLEFETLPTEALEAFLDVQYDYWTALSQIPHVEKRAMGDIEAADSATSRIEAAREVYAYRARDVDAFVRIPALVEGLDDDLIEDLVADLRSFRARYMLFEDFRHIRRDLTEGHYNPAIVLINAADDPAAATEMVEAVHDAFAYDGAASERYADALREMEQRPDDLGSIVRVSRRVLAGEST